MLIERREQEAPMPTHDASRPAISGGHGALASDNGPITQQWAASVIDLRRSRAGCTAGVRKTGNPAEPAFLANTRTGRAGNKQELRPGVQINQPMQPPPSIHPSAAGLRDSCGTQAGRAWQPSPASRALPNLHTSAPWRGRAIRSPRVLPVQISLWWSRRAARDLDDLPP